VTGTRLFPSGPYFAFHVVTRELRRRVRADQCQPRFEPCLTRLAKQPPAGPGWIHEIKHDGFRIIAQREAGSARLITRNGHDLSGRFPLILAAVAALPVQSCAVDGEAIACDERDLSVFEMIRWRQHDNAVTLCAFDLLELDGEDLRREPIEVRKVPSKDYCVALDQVSHSTAISKSTARSLRTGLRSVVKASCRSALGRRTDQAAAIVGSRSRPRKRRP
jgi:ATP-dependent DNA ligase